MSEKTFNSRIVHKHDVESNWLKAVNFIPKQGEIIVYDKDDTHNYERIKIGDGETFVVNLPFVHDNVMDKINSLVGDESVSEQISNSIITRKEKDLIVTYQNGSIYDVTHTTAEIYEAYNKGQTVKFKKDTELLDLLEITRDYATFYIIYLTMDSKLSQKVVVISGNSIMLEQEDTFDYATKTNLTNTLKEYYTKTEVNTSLAEFFSKEEVLTKIQEAVDAIVIPTAVQDDWQENDETSPAYIKNRTHWIDESFSEAVPEMEIEDTYIDLMYKPVFEFLSPDCACQVILDGATYETIAHHNSYNAYEWYIIGNGELLGESGGDTTMPFGLYIDRYDENWGECENSISTFAMNITSSVVHKIPDIYLPERVGAAGTGAYAEIFNNFAENKASGDYAHAEGMSTTASGYASHAEGMNTTANGYGSHAEGNNSQATSAYTHAEGWSTIASGTASHAGGIGTIASSEGQTAIGKYNSATKDYFVVGKGTGDASRANAFTVGSANVWSASPIYIGGTSSTDSSAQEVATKNYVDNAIEIITLETIDSICGSTVN